MLFLLFFLELIFFFLSNVAALNITVQPDTIVGLPSLVLWAREPSDGNGQLVFDLRFVKPGDDDIGLALANIQASPSAQFGTAQVVFPVPGPCVLVAVSGPDYTRIGQSSQVNAFQVPTSTPSTSQPVPSSTSSAKPSSTSPTSSTKPSVTSSVVRRKKNLGAIIGGTLGGVAFLGLLAALGIMFLRRRQPTTTENNNNRKRWTFHRDKMILPPVLDIRRTSPMDAEFFSRAPDDIEQQQVEYPHGDDNNINIPTSPVIMMASSSSSSPLKLKSPHRPLPLPPSVLPPSLIKPHQEKEDDDDDDDDMAVQMDQIRNQMTELEKNPGPTQHIILDDLQKQMNWFKSHIDKKKKKS